MTDHFDGAVVLVTGAARGIGEGIARRFHREGATIIAIDRDERGLAALADALGPRIRPLVVDVSDHEGGIPRAIVDAGGIVDVCVNNAGVFAKAPLLDITPEEWDHVLATNARSVLFVIQAVAPVMIRAGRGRIVNMASGAVTK